MNISFKLIEVVPVENTLGEGVLWRESDATIWWTDIAERKLFCKYWGRQKIEVFSLPERLGSFGFVQNETSMFVGAFESGFALFRPESDYFEWLHRPSELALATGRRLNDGRVGPGGRFWAGSMLETNNVIGGKDQTGLYCLSHNGKSKLVHTGLRISNGIAWDSEGARIYLSDSSENSIYTASFNPTSGKCSRFKIFVKTEEGAPDGAVTDSAGNYWTALWGAGMIACYNPDGKKIGSLQLPIPQPTCIAFGGPDLKHVIITSAREGLTEKELRLAPGSGNVFIFESNIKGCIANEYQFDGKIIPLEK